MRGDQWLLMSYTGPAVPTVITRTHVLLTPCPDALSPDKIIRLPETWTLEVNPQWTISMIFNILESQFKGLDKGDIREAYYLTPALSQRLNNRAKVLMISGYFLLPTLIYLFGLVV